MSEKEKGKIFNDPIHGHIRIPPLCVKIIDTPQFQRLRSIKQLGGTYFVYSGAAHNRFEHSIGVCYLAGKLASILKERQSKLEITEEDILCVQIAGLCHDLGQGPFSRMFKDKFLPMAHEQITHESLSLRMFDHLLEKNDLKKEFKKYKLEPFDIEFIREQINGSPTKDNATGSKGNPGPDGAPGITECTGEKGPSGEMEPSGPSGLPGFAGPQGITGATGPSGERGLRGEKGPSGAPGALGVRGPPGPYGIQGNTGEKGDNGEDKWPYKGRKKDKAFLYEIVANKRNGIDVDKWDYLARDCHMLGIKSNFDHTRCMEYARVIEMNGELQICFTRKEIDNIYDMFHTRYTLHRRAYQHVVGDIIETMIAEAMMKANDVITFTGKNRMDQAMSVAIEDILITEESGMDQAMSGANDVILNPENSGMDQAMSGANDVILNPENSGKKLKISETITDMEAYEKLTDSIIEKILLSEERGLEDSKKIIRKVQKRKLYKFVGEMDPTRRIDPEQKAEVEKYKKEEEKAYLDILNRQNNGHGWNTDDFIIHFVSFDFGMGKKNPFDHISFFNKENPDAAFKEKEKDEIFSLLPKTSMKLRFYCKKEDKESHEWAVKALERLRLR